MRFGSNGWGWDKGVSIVRTTLVVIIATLILAGFTRTTANAASPSAVVSLPFCVRGSGETITNLSTLAGCQNPATVGATLQKNFKTIFPDAAASDDKVGSAIIDTLKTDKSLSCGNLT